MLRSVFCVVLLTFALQPAESQVQFHGVPASVTSPTSNGNGTTFVHGVPSSVTSPAPSPVTSDMNRFRSNQRFRVHFGDPHFRPRRFVPVPVFYPVYGYPADYSAAPADQYVPATEPDPSTASATPADPEALRDAYYQGAHDALAEQQRADSRYGNHYIDSREKREPKTPANDDAKAQQSEQKQAVASGAEAPKKEQPDDSPATVFIFKDGHKVETHNFAIVGQTLFDFSTKPLKKVQLADLDVDATRKANDELGISLTLP